MKIRFLSISQKELDDAVAWYEQQSERLGIRFLDEIDHSLKRIKSFPRSCAEIEPGFRRCLVRRFPYGIIYGIDRDEIVVVAVAHLHREPNYWLDRIG